MKLKSKVKYALKSLLLNDCGMMSTMIGAYSLLFILVLMMAVFQIASFKAMSDKLEDALAASSLAASLIDVEQYGIDHSIIIKDTRNSYKRYKETLSVNLGDLGRAVGLRQGAVKIEDFRIYNVRGGKVTEIYVSDTTERVLREGKIGEVKSPKGQIIENTGIYSEISFPLKKSMGLTPLAKKSKLTSVDVLN